MENDVGDGQASIGTRADRDIFKFMDRVKKDTFLENKGVGKYFLIKYSHDENRENDFLAFILNTIPTYALKPNERVNVDKRIYDVWCTAINRFVQNSNTGEFGELILFHLLELDENAVQIINKIAIKSTPGMYQHGADAVHFSFDGGIKTLYLGEAKTEVEFKKAVKDAFKTIVDYYYGKDSKLKFEINLASGNISEDIKEPYRSQIKKYLDPRNDDQSNLQRVHAVFIGYEFPTLKGLEGKYEGRNLTEKAREELCNEAEKYSETIEKEALSHVELKNKRFLFFVVPFKDLKGLREAFSKVVKNGKSNTI